MNKESDLQKYFYGLKRVVVAYSGGIDSTLALWEAHSVLGSSAVGAIAISSSLAGEDLLDAEMVAKWMNVELIEVSTKEVEDPRYQENSPQRCYFCKDGVYGYLKNVARERRASLVDGFNADDKNDIRPGMKAAKEHGVLHPLESWTKSEIRSVAKKIGLPNHDKPAQSCLASRFKTGVPIDEAVIKKIEVAETAIRDIVGKGSHRFRYLGSDRFRIETGPELLQTVIGVLPQIMIALSAIEITNEIPVVEYQKGAMNYAK